MSEEKKNLKEEERKENAKKVDDKDLKNVSGGIFGFGEDAPDGHEIGCLLKYYDDWNDYVWKNYICEKCNQPSMRPFIADPNKRQCYICKHTMYKNNVQGPKIGPINPEG